MDKKKYLLSKFRDSKLRVEPGERVFVIHQDGSIVEREVEYVFCNMEDGLSIHIDEEGEFEDYKQNICFFNSVEEAKSFRDKLKVDFAIFVKRPQGKYFSTFDSNYDFLMRGSVRPESLTFSENFLDFIQDFDYVKESHFLCALIIHNASYAVPFTGFSIYYVVDDKSKKIEYPCLFKVPLKKVQEFSLLISRIDDPNKIKELCSKLFLTSSEVFGS